jgi:hypothetical protein
MFDVTIVAQSILYRPKRGRRASREESGDVEEQEGLISAGARDADEPASTPRRRVTIGENVGT